MMNEILKNKEAWSKLSKDHYEHFKVQLKERDNLLNEIIIRELGDIRGKSLIHLQCNTGADTISLARLGLSKVVGVDLSDENVYYASKLKDDFNMKNISFIESDVLKLSDIHKEKYDIVFTSEGVLGWLPDLRQWAKVVRSLLKDDGYFYVYDSHPFFHVLDDELITKNQVELKYDYFNAPADKGFDIGGYACETKHSENYWWNHTFSDIVNALIHAGLKIEFLNEYESLFWNNGNMEEVTKGLFIYPKYKNKLPMSYSIKASVSQ